MLEITGQNHNTDTKTIESFVDAIFLKFHLSKENLVELIFVPADKIRKINRDYRDIDKVTDVLSFPQSKYPGKKSILGTIIICNDETKLGHRHITNLVKHGLLHLFGYDHETKLIEWNKAESKI